MFFDELVTAIRGALEQAGVATEEAVDHFPRPEPRRVYVLVPHEYIPLTGAVAHPSPEHLKRAVVIATEQPGTPWFEESAAVAAEAGAVLDINVLGLRELERRGVSARLLQLGYVPAWDAWGGEERTRSIDVTFMGGHTPRRGRILASCGRVLQAHRPAIHLYESLVPHRADDPAFFSGERKWRHLASSKILLNVHRDESPYLEWQRVLGAMANGAVVLTEHVSGFAPLVPGDHFLPTAAESLPTLLEDLLEDDARLEALRRQAYDFLREELPLTATVSTLAEAIEEVGRRAAAKAAGVRPQPPAPLQPQSPEPEWERVLAPPTELDLLRRGLKHMILAQRRLDARLRRLEEGEPGEDAVWTFGPYSSSRPRISVVVTLYNYEAVVGEALASVAASEGKDIEVLVVDDASLDDSVAAARAALEQAPWLASKLISRGANAGLAAARNLGIAEARGEYVFMLDADNAVYPHALARLATALDEDHDAAFAYGLIEQFDASGPIDLMSWHYWSPARFRYGNYIDAMAMTRKSAFTQVGGFTLDERLYGWEDFALWCSFAQAGLRGRLVPEILTRYRTNRHSMIGITNIDVSEAWSVLVERYPFLVDEDPS